MCTLGRAVLGTSKALRCTAAGAVDSVELQRASTMLGAEVFLEFIEVPAGHLGFDKTQELLQIVALGLGPLGLSGHPSDLGFHRVAFG